SRGTAAFAECIHPVFRTHEDTGRNAVYVNRLMTVGIVDMPAEESEPLLNAVFDHSEKRAFVYEHVWREGRSPAVGQPLLVTCAPRFSRERASADAAHHGQGHGGRTERALPRSRSLTPRVAVQRGAGYASAVFNTENNFSTSASVFHTCGVTRIACPRTET